MIYIIRHGQTQGNAAKLLQGRCDNPLNEKGVDQAYAASERLRAGGVHFARVYTSPLSRAKKTGAIVAEGVEQVVDERLIEMDYGPYEGMPLDNPAPEVLAFFKDFAGTPAPDGMEPLADIVARLGAFLEDIRSDAAEQDILVSTHAIAMKGALEYLTPDSHGSYWSTYIANCAVYVCGFEDDGGWAVPYEWDASQ